MPACFAAGKALRNKRGFARSEASAESHDVGPRLAFASVEPSPKGLPELPILPYILAGTYLTNNMLGLFRETVKENRVAPGGPELEQGVCLSASTTTMIG
jgi:hypothetical protein